MRSAVLALVPLPSAGLCRCCPPDVRAIKRPRPAGLDQLRSVQRSHVRRFCGGFLRRSRPSLSALLLLSAHLLRPSLRLHCSPSSGLNRTVLHLSRCTSASKKAQPRRTAPKKKKRLPLWQVLPCVLMLFSQSTRPPQTRRMSLWRYLARMPHSRNTPRPVRKLVDHAQFLGNVQRYILDAVAARMAADQAAHSRDD